MSPKTTLLIASMPLVALLAGCASETMRTTKPPGPNDGATAGIPYFLPRLAVRVTVTGTKPSKPEEKYKFAVTMKSEYVADGSEPYFLEYLEDDFSDDIFKIRVGANGLLQSTDSKSKDRSADVIGKLAELAVRSVSALGGPGRTQIASTPPPPAECALPSFTAEKVIVVGLPTSAPENIYIDVKGNRVDLGTLKADAKISAAQPITKTPTHLDPPSTRYKDHEGVVFPVVQPITADLTYDPSAAAEACTATSQAQVVNALAPSGKTFRVDVSRAAFVTKHVVLAVDNGILTGIDVDKPSEALGLINIPVEVLKSLVSVPGELLSVKVKQMQEEGSLTKAEAELLKQQLEVIKAQQALDQARAASGQ